MDDKVAILGSGAMGTALAQLLASNGHRVTIWGIEGEVLEGIARWHRNPRYLPGVVLHRLIGASLSLEEAVQGVGLVAVAVPSSAVREVGKRLALYMKAGTAVLSVAKGLEPGTSLRMSQVLAQELPGASIAALAGPALSHELGRRRPTVLVVASSSIDTAQYVRSLLAGRGVSVVVSDDVCGVELAAVLKNVYSILLGMCEGVGLGANAKGCLAVMALQEMVQIVVALGGRAETVTGPAGLGDLLASGYSRKGRNLALGRLLGRKGPWQDYLAAATVEGFQALKPLQRLVKAAGIDPPVLQTIVQAVEGRGDPEALMTDLMVRCAAAP